MVRKVILCLSIIFFCFCRVMAQSADTLFQPDIYYSSPKTYEIAGIEVTGIGEQYDPETLILATGLRVGSEVKIPGDAITKAIRRLYGQGLFSDVTISVDRVEGQKVFLIIWQNVTVCLRLTISDSKNRKKVKLKRKSISYPEAR
jgi:outer membrane protein insertion porin family